ncbi:MAG: winged helix-turn-helix transcriptional regulator [Pseudomonadales bacterium]|nr:winged helix-turn-helix transcriptional regulator [Pseudomonadales bacterium]
MAKTELKQTDLDHYRKTNVGQALLEVARDFQKGALEEYSRAGHRKLQSSHQAILTYLSLDGTRLTELAARASMTKQAMGQLVDEVERLGYVERIPDPSDGRAKIVRFTRKGRMLIKEGTEIGEEIQRKYASMIGENKMRRLRDLLEELHHKIHRKDQ